MYLLRETSIYLTISKSYNKIQLLHQTWFESSL